MTPSRHEEDNSGQTQILARDGLSANDPKRTLLIALLRIKKRDNKAV